MTHGETDDTHSERAMKVVPLLLLPPIPTVAERTERMSVRIELVQVACALAAYHAEQRAYPEKLDALAPGQIDRVPLDPFNGQTLH